MSGISIIPGGPALPLALVEALESERLVFFCGAGISRDSGLPDFKTLTIEAIDRHSGTDQHVPIDPVLRDAFSTQQYDKALDILERNTAGNLLRDHIAERLTAPPIGDTDLPLHGAILALAKRRDAPDGNPRGYRLVTTNYDDRFERAGLERRWIESAPHLSRPRAADDLPGYASFLHGRIETEKTKRDPSHRELVLTSADFGNAYMRDGFAARFVLELFREFTVLFIGYSINDPVMRYLVDIFATERVDQRKGQFNDAYAITSFKDGQEAHERQLWQAKNVEPILYDSTDGHQRLTDLMSAWSRLHKSGADGRFSRFLEITRKPHAPGSSDSDLATAAWALADKHSRTAERLANLIGLPSEAKGEPDEGASPMAPEDADISWFGPLLQAEIVDPRDERRPRKRCRLLEIPEVARYLCRWAMRHLTTDALVDWAIENEQLLLSSLREPFFDALIPHLQGGRNAPPVVGPYSHFWEVLIEIAVRHSTTNDLRSLFRAGPARPSPPDALMRSIEQSEIQIAWPSEPGLWRKDAQFKPCKLSDLATFRIEGLGRRILPRRYKDLFTDPTDQTKARDDLAPYLDDLTSLLLEICRLARTMDAPFATGESYVERPSIQPDESNNLEHAQLSWLIEALVLSFARAATDDTDHATTIAMRWRHLWRREELTLFGRLYLHAAMVLPEVLKADRLIDDLLDPPDVLWSSEYRAEVLPVLRLRATEASRDQQTAMVHGLLEAPPAGTFRADREDMIERFRGQRLAWLKLGGVVLTGKALSLAEAYLMKHPASEDPRADEVFYRRHFVRVGAIGTGTSLVGQPIGVILASLKANHDPQGWPIRAWDRSKRVADWLREEPQRFVEALDTFSGEADLPDGPFDGIFWALGSLKPERPEDAAPVIAAIDFVLRHDDRLITPYATAVAGWLENIASWANDKIDEERFFRLWDCTQAHAPEDEVPTDASATLDSAINAFGGKLAEALRDRLWQTKPRVGQGLPDRFKARLEQLIHGETLASLHARLVYMQALDPLFAVDPGWTRQHLLPRLSRLGAFGVQAAWHWRAHLLYGAWSLQLAQAYRADFLEMLGALPDRDSETFRAACQRFAALGAIYGLFAEGETRQTCRTIGPEGLIVLLDTLQRRMVEGDKPTEMWRHSIGPWLERYWPAEARFSTEQVFEAIAELIIEADEAFADALAWAEARALVRPLADRYDVLWRLTLDEPQAERHRMLPVRFPAELCRFLSQIMGTQPLQSYERERLTAILHAIEESPRYDTALSSRLIARLQQL